MNVGVDLVIKVGGSLARRPGLAERLNPIHQLWQDRRSLVVVPGGGSFADAVRAASARHRLAAPAAHWMAILGMDQYAYLLADALADGTVVRRPAEIARALAAGRLPVLAPFEWIHAEDPLPHAWSVTSDSIAAWVAGRLAARKLILLKSGAEASGVDAYFRETLPTGLVWETVTPESTGWRPTM